MEISSVSIKKIFREKGRNIIYGAVLAVFFGIGGLVFIWSVAFLTKAVNIVVGSKVSTGEITPTTVDIVKFSTISGRLGISFTPPRPGAPRAPEPAPPPPEPEPTPPPAEAPPEEPDLSQIKAQILNGTTIAGLAKTWKGYFESEGLSDIATGNAQRRNYDGVTIQYKLSASLALEKVREVISGHGAAIAEEIQAEESSLYDITLIIGK